MRHTSAVLTTFWNDLLINCLPTAANRYVGAPKALTPADDSGVVVTKPWPTPQSLSSRLVKFRMSSRIWSWLGRPAMLRPTSWEMLKSARYTLGRKTALRCVYPPRRLDRY